MKSKIFMSLLTLLPCTILTEREIKQISLQRHEQWWQKNCVVEKKLEEFSSWLGDLNADSRVKMRNYIKNKGYKSVLDIPSGLCIDFYGFKKDKTNINYHGIDITPYLVKRAKKLGISVSQGTIENIQLDDSSFDVAYARHILEHLNHYQKAINELVRVAEKEVIIIFFIKPKTINND